MWPVRPIKARAGAPRNFPCRPILCLMPARTLGKGAAALGLDWQANSRAALSLPWDDRLPCNYCGGCNKGCPRGDKGSADVTFIAAALATGRCTVRPDSPVIRIEARARRSRHGRPGRTIRWQHRTHRGSSHRAGLRRRRNAAPAAGVRRTSAMRAAKSGRNFMDTLEVTRRGAASRAAARSPRSSERRDLHGISMRPTRFPA